MPPESGVREIRNGESTGNEIRWVVGRADIPESCGRVIAEFCYPVLDVYTEQSSWKCLLLQNTHGFVGDLCVFLDLLA